MCNTSDCQLTVNADEVLYPKLYFLKYISSIDIILKKLPIIAKDAQLFMGNSAVDSRTACVNVVESPALTPFTQCALHLTCLSGAMYLG